eukprot:631398-Prorocentrum_minimum.AAC.4
MGVAPAGDDRNTIVRALHCLLASREPAHTQIDSLVLSPTALKGALARQSGSTAPWTSTPLARDVYCISKVSTRLIERINILAYKDRSA